MDSDSRIGHLRWLFERQLHWISAADVKAGGLVAAYMALVAIAASTLVSSTNIPGAAKALFAVSGLLMVPGLGFAMSVFFPRTKANHDSLIYFGEISKHDAAQFCERFQAVDTEVMELDLINQIHVNAVIAECKHRHARCSLVLGGFSLVAWLAAVSTTAFTT